MVAAVRSGYFLLHASVLVSIGTASIADALSRAPFSGAHDALLTPWDAYYGVLDTGVGLGELSGPRSPITGGWQAVTATRTANKTPKTRILARPGRTNAG